VNTRSFSRGATLLGALVFLASCSSDDPAGPSEPATGVMTVVIGDDDGAAAGLHVLVQDSDGAMKSQALTNGMGQAAVDITSGDMVTTVVEFEPDYFALRTIVGVQPEDHFTNLPTSNNWDDPTQVVIVEGDTPDGHDTLLFGTGCSSGGGSITFPYTTRMFEGCMTESGLLHMCWESLVDQDRQAFAYVTDVPYETSDTTTVDLTGLWRTDWQEVNLALPDPPANTTSFSVTPWPERDGASFNNLETVYLGSGETIPTDHTLTMARGFPESVLVQFRTEGDDANYSLNERFAVDGNTTELAFSFTPPMVTAGTAQFDEPGRPVLSWSVQPSILDANGIKLYLWWDGEEDLRYSWIIYLPPGTTSFQIPEFPAELAAIRPPEPSVENAMGSGLECIGNSALDGYDGFRANLRRTTVLPWSGGGNARSYVTWTDLGVSPNAVAGMPQWVKDKP